MKIIQIHNEYTAKGGEDIVVENEKKLLIKNGHKVFQLVKKNKNEIKNFFDKIKIAKNLIHSKNSKKFVLKKLRIIKPDIVHVHNTFPIWTFSVINACNELKIPVIMTIHNFRLICANGSFYRRNDICELCLKSSVFNAIKYGCYKGSFIKSIPVALMIKFYKKGLSLVDRINRFIVLTNFSKKKLLQAKFPNNKISIKPNFVFNVSKDYSDINKEGFLFASRLTEEKGLIDLVNIHNQFNFNLKVCGEGPLKNYIKNNKKINYLGFLNKTKLQKAFINSKFFIFPSKVYETFGNVIIEAFAYETVVIAPNLGSISTIIKDRYNGILFEPNNSDDLLDKIKWAISNNNKCETIKINAKKIFEKKYSDKVNYKILFGIYKNAIRENNLIFQKPNFSSD